MAEQCEFLYIRTVIKEKLNIDINNPDALSLMQRLFRFVFGKDRPDLLTRSYFFTHLVAASLFFFWYISAYLSIHFLENIRGALRLKKMITRRGVELGVDNFREAYETLAFIMIIVWIIYLAGLILLWRKNKIYRYFMFPVLIAYPLLIVFFLNITYILEDVSLFDYVLYLIMLVSLLVYYWIDKRRRSREEEDTEISVDSESGEAAAKLPEGN